ncbi:MAG TPA: HAMP domain-containing sensor histidine kinase [Bacteroidales bacterium]
MTNSKPHKILVVDDEPSNLFLLEGLLAEEGFHVFTALNGEDAIVLAKTELPDVILLDIMMPRITGIDVLKVLMKEPLTCNIPVIMVTARVEAEDVEEALTKGAVEYIKKPINEVEMLARLRATLRLKKQEDNLRALLKSKEDFISMVSHDVRGSFSSISGFAELLLTDDKLAGSLNSDHKEFLNLIIDTSNYIYDYFNKLLNWANLGANELNLQKEKIALAKLVRVAEIVYKSKINEKDLELVVDIPDDFKIWVDPTYFSQVINNLISNAIKYSHSGGKIRLSIDQRDKGIQFVVADTGVGMPNISEDELFGKSFHKSTRGTRGEKGTGVGLRICKMILDAHGFGFNFKSQSNRGTEFIIEMKSE